MFRPALVVEQGRMRAIFKAIAVARAIALQLSSILSNAFGQK
ncbi:hypothetical protein [Lusitaniella coriacea]|nr:hypothetical protein [Lusitaniella coriacea]